MFLSVDPVTAYSNPVGQFHRYRYANTNPYRFTDPDGRWAEDLVIGVPSIIMGAKSFANNVQEGNAGAAVADAVGIVVDAAAILTPGVPGGAGAAIGIVRGVDKAVDASKAGRSANKLKPDSRATGDHSTLNRNASGNTTHTATYTTNPKNPSGFQETKRVDVTGRGHRNPDGNVVPTPHVKEAGEKLVRPARPEELPRI